MVFQSAPSPMVARPFEIQKLQLGAAPQVFLLEYSPFYEASSSHSFQEPNQDFQIPAQNTEFQQTETVTEGNSSDPFFYYQESHVKESIKHCQHSLIGKILAEKPISTQILYNTLSSIWCKHVGLKINELEGKIIQIQMENEDDIQRILKGSPWIIRNCWLVLHNWDRNLDVKSLDFDHVPLWIQFWGLPLHCRSIIMGQELGSQLGTVLDVGLYEFPEKAKTVKVKISFNIQNPIRAGMFIGNDNDGITWIDFRFKNLPMFCFGCGLVGHNLDVCKNPPLQYEGGTNPRGVWLRTKIFGRRMVERAEKTFSSNPLKSLYAGQFSPIPKGLMDKMGSMSISKQGENSSGQRAKIQWLQQGDLNTTFFHHKANQRRRKNQIYTIKDSTGNSHQDSYLIHKNFLDYFKNIFTSTTHHTQYDAFIVVKDRINPTDFDLLNKDFSIEEVRTAIKSLKSNYAPGPDGLTALFFHHYWEIIGNDILDFVLNILNNDGNISHINHTYISLIPKISSPNTPADFRPISLCNVILKIVTKTLANRVKQILPHIIKDFQSAFLPGRLITDNSLIVFETFQYLKKT